MKIAVSKYFSLIIITLILTLGIAAYSNSFRSPFTFDDHHYIIDNPGLQLGSLSSSEWQEFIDSFTTGKGASVRKRFIPFLSFALNYYAGDTSVVGTSTVGTSAGGYNVFGYHLVNLLIHLLAAIGLYFLMQNILRLPRLKERYGEQAHYIASGVSLLFLLHPVQTEAVTFIWQRCTSLGALFYFFSLLSYIKGRCSPSPRCLIYYLIFLVTAICALFSKQNTATLPLFIILLEVYFFEDINWQQIKAKLVYLLGLVATFILIAISYTSLNFSRWVLGWYAKRSFSLAERVLTQLRVVVHYLSLLLFPLPSRLNLDYDFPLSRSLTQPLTTLLSLLLIAGLLFVALYLAKRKPLISFGILWWLGNLVIESSVIGLEMVYEHRLYLPSVGLFIILSLGIWGLLDRLNGKTRLIWGVAIWGLILLTLATFTHQRNFVWGDELRLWQDVVKKSANKARPHSNLAFIYNKLGKYDEAIPEAQQALKLNPHSRLAANNLGVAYYHKGMYDEARQQYQAVLEQNPQFARSINNLGLLYVAKGAYQQAIELYQQVLSLEPNNAKAYNNLGNAYNKLGQYDEALKQFIKAKKLRPDLAEVYNNLGVAYYHKQMYAEAKRVYEQALALKPDYVEAITNLGVIYYKRKQRDEAKIRFEQALGLNPDDVEAHNNLGVIYAEQGRLEEALGEYQTVLRINPNHVDALANMAGLYAGQEKVAEAIKLYQRALELKPNMPLLHYQLGNLYERQRRYLKALDKYDQTLQLAPNFIPAYAKIGLIYRGYGQFGSALDYYRRAWQLSSDPRQRKQLQEIIHQIEQRMAAEKK